MTIFAILPPSPNPALEARIRAAYPNDCLSLAPNQWLVSANGTVIDVAREIGVVPPEGAGPSVGTAVIIAMASYYGRASTPVWDWIKTKLEA